MATTTTTRKRIQPPASAPVITEAELAELRADLQCSARVTACVAGRSANVRWTEFRKLLTDVYMCSHPDADRFIALMAGRKP